VGPRRRPAQAEVTHPGFAWCYARLAAAMEGHSAAEHRRRLLQGIAGRVLEVGAGTGASFAYYPSAVTELVAVEPERHLRTLADRAATDAAMPVTVVDGVAERLPGSGCGAGYPQAGPFGLRGRRKCGHEHEAEDGLGLIRFDRRS
jgi:hypothetical protein